MRIVIAGGTGQLGGVLARHLGAEGHEVLVVGRSVPDPDLRWDGRSDGPWCQAIDGADAVVNLAGRTVNCRYNWPNLNEMMQSRVDSTLAIGRAIAASHAPPPVWIQSSTASIYADRHDQANDEATGTIGGREPDVPPYWAYSVAIARAWELALASANTPTTRKVVLRTGFTMSPDPGGIFDVLMWLVRRGLGGPVAGGRQRVSWIVDEDWAAAVSFLLHDTRASGIFNLTAPNPVTQAELMRALREAAGDPIAIPISGWMAALGAVYLRTDPELIRKSRFVVPRRLLEAGFEFRWTDWSPAARALVRRWREERSSR